MHLPITTSLVPVPIRLAQQLRGDMLVTRPAATGRAQLCRVHNLHIDAHFFPDVSALKPIAVIMVHDFRMVFPSATFVPGQAGRRVRRL